MDCRAAEDLLIDFIKGELPPLERAQLERHLEACAGCRRERKELESTFALLRRELVPIELSAHFRMALADRLDEATDESASVAPAPRVVRASERHIRDMRKPALVRLWEHARRSPYFAASLLAHAAAVFVIFAILLQMPERTDPRVVNEYAPRGGTPSLRLDPAYQAYLERDQAHRIKTEALPVPGGVTVDLAQFMMTGGETLVLVRDEALGCLQGYFAEQPGGPSAADVLARHEGGLVRVVQDAKVAIPDELADVFAPSGKLFAFRLMDRIEFWSRPVWNDLRRRFRQGPLATARFVLPHAQAVLPRRERLA